MDQLIQAAHVRSPVIQHTGAIEHLQQVNPQAGPAPVPYCPPRSVVAHAGPPVGPPVAVHEPAPGEHIVVPIVPNQPLAFDFNPLDLKATEHGQNVTLTFPDGAQVTLHDIIGYYGPQPVPLELPDGTVMTSGQLLEAFHLSLMGPCGGPALNEINPTAGPTPVVENTGFETQPFNVGGLGTGLTPDGPLAPTGFSSTAEFLRGVGGGVPTPPGPPGPPGPPPPGHFLTVPDIDLHTYSLGVTSPAPTHVSGTNYTVDLTGNYISEVVSSSPAAFIEGYYTLGHQPLTFGTPASPNPGGLVDGTYGTFSMDAAGSYAYTLNAASEHALSQLGSDMMSESVNAHWTGQGYYQAGFLDAFDVVTSNGTDTAGNQVSDFKQIQFGFESAAVSSAPAVVDVTAHTAGTTELLLSYTDAVDPAHTFQQLVTVGTNGLITASPESGTIVQPNDPALVSLEYVSGPGATVSSVAIEGGTLSIGATIDSSQHAFSAMLNPTLDQLGDNGDTGSVSASVASTDNASYTATGLFNDSSSSGFDSHFGYLFDSSSTIADASSSGGSANTINYDGGAASGIALTGSSTADSTNIFEWSSPALLSDSSGNTPGISIDGGSGNGLNMLQLESATSQNLTFDTITGFNQDLTAGTNIKNIEVFDLTDGAHSSTANSITLTADDVFNLAHNEPAAVQNAGGAYALWINGSSADTVNLAGSNWTQISQPVTQAGQSGGNASQMVGYTEYAATTTGNQQVHVYVENAIKTAGHVTPNAH
jgi:hypothetical protein